MASDHLPTVKSSPSKKLAILLVLSQKTESIVQTCVFPFSCLILLTAVVVASNVVVPLLVVSILIMRFLQFFAHDIYYEIAAYYKRVLLLYLCVALVLILLEMGLIYPLAKYVPYMRKLTIIGLPLTELIQISCALCGFYFLICMSCLMSWKFFSEYSESLEQYGSISEIYDAVSEGISCLFLWWAELVVLRRHVPSYESSKIRSYGLETHELIEVLIFIAIGYNGIRVSTYATVWALWKLSSKTQPRADDSDETAESILLNTKKYLMYCAVGLRRSFNFLFSSAMLALTWELYVRAHITESEAKEILEFGAWTGFSLFLCSVLWLIKNGILLLWEAREVYLRLQSDILDLGKDLYFLGILGCDKHDIFRLSNQRGRKKVKNLRECFLARSHGDSRRSYSLYELHQVAQYFLISKDVLSKDKYIVDLQKNVRTKLGSGEIDDKTLKEFIVDLLKKGPTRIERKKVSTTEESPGEKTEMND